MTPEERQIKAIFFQTRRMNIYESEPALIVSLANAINAAIKAEREACVKVAEQAGEEEYESATGTSRQTMVALTQTYIDACNEIAQAIRTRGEEEHRRSCELLGREKNY